MAKDSLEALFVSPKQTIKAAMEVIDKGLRGIALIIDEKGTLVGIVTDPDIRKAIIKGVSLDQPVKDIMNENYTFVTKNYSTQLVKTIFEQKRINQLPVVDDSMKVVDIIMYHDFFQKRFEENFAVIMAGGLGTRLYPLTKDIPKPMLRLGGKPILETIIEQLKLYGYRNIIICLNYKSDIILNYFQDGSDFDVNIRYVKEKKRLGTAGALKLAEKYLNKSFLVINGDVLTKLNFQQFMKEHQKKQNLISIATKQQEIHIPYGVLSLNEENVIKLEEKPSLNYFVSSGIYCLEPETLNAIPKDQYFDITQLINLYISTNKKVGSFPITEYWMDIGHLENYEQANMDYDNLFRSEACATKE